MKNVVRKLVIVMAFILSFCMFSNVALAANTTNNTDNTQKNTSTSKNESNTKKETKTEKSSNANLSDLGIKPHDFSGFKYGTTTYDVTVPANVDQIEVYAKTQDEKAKVNGTGMKTLKDGLNTFEVKVTAENGATKTYTINVTREAEEKEEESDSIENTENVQEKYSGDGLASLTIGDLELSPKFDTTIYEYKVKYIGEATKLDIKATGTDPYYDVEITGNENLKEGENLITILVSDPDGNNVATYQVTVNKSLVDEEAIAREQEEAKKKEELRNMLIIGGIVAVVVAIIVIILIVRHSRHKAWAEEYTIPYSGLNNDDDYEDDEVEYEDKHDEKISKEKAREAFLSGYNSDNKNDYKEKDEEPRRKHKKGKRFK